MLISLMSWKGDVICVCPSAYPIIAVGVASPTLLLCYIIPFPYLPTTLLQRLEGSNIKIT